MSKTERLLDALIANLGEWTCSLCNSGSNQPAAIFRELKKQGYQFEEPAPRRWATSLYCDFCGMKSSHYKLLSSKPVFAPKPRIPVSKVVRARLLVLLDNRDAFTGARITSVAEIDHKVPWSRLSHDVDTTGMSDAQLLQHFQLLTKEHNLLKDRACQQCIDSSHRTPFLAVPFWYEGDVRYRGTCLGCGWHDGKAWRAAVQRLVEEAG